jgi:ubiquinone/menaquinone biosynthesis C-methylase UbiE
MPMNRIHHWLCASNFWRKTLRNDVMPWALDGVELGSDVLEIGPGPGLTTEFLRERFARVTSIEIDPGLAKSLRARMRGSNVEIVEGDATQMPFPGARFSGAVSFTMLHHVPTRELQDKLLAEARRVLKPGGILAGVDSRISLRMRFLHIGDVLNIVPPETFASRLEAAGFKDVFLQATPRRFRFHARRG